MAQRVLEQADIAYFRQCPEEARVMAVLVLRELERARDRYAPMASAHEGIAVIQEEVEELWDEIKKRDRDRVRTMEECVQVAAMALRFLIDVVREGR